MMLSALTALILLLLGMSFVLLVARFWRGPTNFDRLVAFESIAIVFICLAAFCGWYIQTPWLFDAILVLSLIGFLSTAAIALHLKQGGGT